MVMTRRLHMGCGETLQSHLPDSFRKPVTMLAMRTKHVVSKPMLINRKGKCWK